MTFLRLFVSMLRVTENGVTWHSSSGSNQGHAPPFCLRSHSGNRCPLYGLRRMIFSIFFVFFLQVSFFKMVLNGSVQVLLGVPEHGTKHSWKSRAVRECLFR